MEKRKQAKIKKRYVYAYFNFCFGAFISCHVPFGEKVYVIFKQISYNSWEF